MTATFLAVRGLQHRGTAMSCQWSAAQGRGGWTHRGNPCDQLEPARLPRRQRRRIEAPACFRRVHRQDVKAQHRAVWSQASTSSYRFHCGHAIARRVAPCRTHGVARRRGVPRLLCPQRGAVGHVPCQQRHALHRGARVQPNPSLNRSANGRPPAPGRWYAVHFHRPGAGVLPSSPG